MKSRILIVEDESIEAMNFEETLKSCDYDVVGIASSGEDAIKKVTELRPDLVLMDIVLKGDMDGIDAAAKIKDEVDIPVIYLTAHPEESAIKRAKLTSPHGYIVKPFQQTDLKNTIELALYKHQMESKLKESEAKYRELFDNTLDMITLGEAAEKSLPGKLIEVNRMAVERLKYTRQELLNMTPIDIIVPEERSEIPKISKNLKKFGYDKFETIQLSKDGERTPVEVYNHKFKLDGKDVVLSVSRDITRRKKNEEIQQIEQKLAYALSESSDLIETLNICLDAAIKISRMDSGGIYLVDDDSGDIVLKVHSRLPSDFVAIASHYEAGSPNAKIVMAGKPIYTVYNKLGIPIPKVHVKEKIRGVAIIPVKYQGKVIANLNIASHTMDQIPDQNRKALETIAGQIGGAIIRSKAEKALFESERRYRELVDNSMVAVYESNFDGEILFVNDSMVKMFDYESVDDLKSKNIVKLYKNAVDREKLIKKLKKAGTVTQSEIEGVTKSGRTFTGLVNAHLLENTITGMVIDITKNKRIQEALRESEEKYRTLFEEDPDYNILIDLDGIIVDVNKATTNMLGFSKEELIGKKLNELGSIPPEDMAHIIEKKSLLSAGKKVKTFESRLIDKEGNIHWVLVHLTSIMRNEEVTHFLGIATDITELKIAENKIESSLREKETLLKEIHHRVKNNLQIISSLLDLQKSYVNEDPTAINVLKGSQDRVISMAMVHEMLYQSKDLNRINISDYIKNLISDLFYSYDVKNNIKSVLSVKDSYLNIETSTPLGLIISELVSNSLKYAFPDERAGEIGVTFQCQDDHFKLIISDNGVGLPEHIDFKNVESTLGLKLVDSLIQQINGTIKLDRNHPGTKFTIKFKELKYKERI